MPYYRRRFRRSNRYSRRRNFRRSSRSTRGVATKQYVKKQIHKLSETKYFDALFSANVDSTGTVADMTNIPQGTTDSTRIGDKITLRGSILRLKISVSDAFNFIRVILFQWYPNTLLSVPTVGTILFDTTTADRAITSPYVHDYQNQFKVISDKVYRGVLDDSNMIAFRVMKPYMKYVKKTINFSAASVNGSNKLYMMAISDSGAITHPAVFAYWRIYYDDS